MSCGRARNVHSLALWATVPSCDKREGGAGAMVNRSCRNDVSTGHVRCFRGGVVLASLVLLSCGASSTSSPGDADAGALPEFDLTGTWDVIATVLGKTPAEVTVEIDAQHLRVTVPTGSFSAQKNGDGFLVVHTDGAGPHQVVVRQLAGALQFGAIPLNLSGAWTARSPEGNDGLGCDATLSKTDFTGLSLGVRLPKWVGPYDPRAGSAMGQKLSDASSIFGDLGGTWRMTTNQEPICTFRFERANFNSQCTDGLGGLDITFQRDGTASGTTTSGVEFTAKRR